MDFELSADDLALQKGIEELCRGRLSMERIRAMEATGILDRAIWNELADAGVFSLRSPGGLGLGMVQAVVVFEQLGRALAPGPLVASHMAAAFIEGNGITGLVEAGAGPVLVEHLDSLDHLIILGESEARLVNPQDVRGAAIAIPLDPLTPLTLADAVPAGSPIDADVPRLRLEGAALTAAFQVGIATAMTERATAYAKERRQFDRPIGSFQAVKHLCADMLVRAEVARAAVYAAAVMIDDPSAGDPARATRGAQLLSNEAAVANGKACVQVFGGMGFTWEVDVHVFLKRAALLATHFGGNDEHAEAMAGYL